MYFAGRLESRNVREYIDAAEYAEALEMNECAAEMIRMSRVEGEHEHFFSRLVAGHHFLPAAKRLFKWS